jgi:ATP-binding cassette subfamily C (CFTR/MRP) protein 5
MLKGTIDETVAGLALVYALECCSLLSWAVRVFIETETAMTSVERLNYYTKLQPEAAADSTPANTPSPSWPAKGGISIKGVNMRYRPELPLVLKGLTLEVKPQEKIGICGRTGSGKSSIAAALFRIVEFEGGSITIDGINIQSIGLRDLRSKLSIIPQDPVLFCEYLRVRPF